MDAARNYQPARERVLHQRPIDLAHLARQTFGDEGIEQEVLRVFEQTVANYARRLRAGTQPSDMLQYLRVIKGAAAGVGAWGLRDLAASTESDLERGEPINAEKVDDIAVAVEEISAFVGEVLTHEPA